MDFSSGAAGSHMVMQAYDERSAELFGLQHANPNPSWLQGGGAADGGGGNFSVRPRQEELSLSLAKPSDTISFHLSGTASSSSHHHHHHQEQLFMQDIGSERFYQSQQQQQSYHLKSSKYLFPAQELLNEFCSLGAGNANTNRGVSPKMKDGRAASSQWVEEGGPSSLYSMDPADLQKRKAKLLAMLEEVYKRYRRYCEQMRAVVSAFEAAAGEGSARVYSTLASKAMSRHFRCLRDGIKGQIRATRTAMGETHAVVPGTTRGETPRLKKLEQCLRQQKAFQQAGAMESQPWRPQRGLPERSVSVLRAWLFEHFLHPYPSDVDKHILARQTGLSRSQVSNWFINARVRLWKPMVEEMYMEEVKDEENPNIASSSHPPAEDQKPGPEQLLNDLSGSLSSIINSRHPASNLNPNLSFGVIDNMDFAAPSLTLGPHDVGQAAGMSLSFSPASQHPLLFAREHNLMDDGQQVHQYSILDEEGHENLPYRNLMGAHLLHDLI